jgi:1-acyl-sn-glycerol-3-phosphate acyltransferase
MGIFQKAVAGARGVAIAYATFGMLSRAEVLLAFTPRSEREALFQSHLKRWAGLQLRLMGIDLHTKGEVTPADGGRLVVSSHRSAIDILIATSLFGGRILSRGDIADWPIAGRLARRTGTIFVDRDSQASGAAAIRQIRRALRDGHTITVFPEGTTYPGDQVRPFRAGVFAAAAGLDVEIVPMGVAYPAGVEYYQESFVAHLSRVAGRRTTPVGAAVGTPQRVAGRRAAELAAALEVEVQALTHAARESVIASARAR